MNAFTQFHSFIWVNSLKRSLDEQVNSRNILNVTSCETVSITMLHVCLQPAWDLLELLKSIHANYVPSNIAAVLGKWLLQHCDMTYLLVVAFFLLLPLKVRLRSAIQILWPTSIVVRIQYMEHGLGAITSQLFHGFTFCVFPTVSPGSYVHVSTSLACLEEPRFEVLPLWSRSSSSNDFHLGRRSDWIDLPHTGVGGRLWRMRFACSHVAAWCVAVKWYVNGFPFLAPHKHRGTILLPVFISTSPLITCQPAFCFRHQRIPLARLSWRYGGFMVINHSVYEPLHTRIVHHALPRVTKTRGCDIFQLDT